MRRAADAYGFDLDYSSRLSWQTYVSMLEVPRQSSPRRQSKINCERSGDGCGAGSMASLIDQRLALALEAAQLGTWTWNIAAGATEWDLRLEELHGLAPGGFGGTFEDWVSALHPEDRAECLARVEKALAVPGPYTLLHRTIWLDGSVHYIECRGTVLVDDEGRPTGTTGVAIDVTDRERNKALVAETLARQREVVEILQQALLPAELPRVPGTDLAARYISAEDSASVGGDWYAVVPLPDNRLGLAIGDVAGHGLAAVTDMAAVRFSLRAIALNEPAPERVLERLNEIVRVFAPDAMVTALYGVLDPQSRTWTYATAGHCPALLRYPDATTILLDEPCDPPLGVATSFSRYCAAIQPGATLVLYTDGLIERRTELISTGLDRLQQTCREGPSEPEAMCDYLVDVMLRSASAADDIAMVVACIN
jgi:PAS domain S-box-containing protein